MVQFLDLKYGVNLAFRIWHFHKVLGPPLGLSPRLVDGIHTVLSP